jgi:hypothetical protein
MKNLAFWSGGAALICAVVPIAAGMGLVVIGVHAPEFGFEKEPVNVRSAECLLTNIFAPA